MMRAYLVAVVEVDKDDRIRCQAEGCGHPVYKRIHIALVGTEFKVFGSQCYSLLYGHRGKDAVIPQYGNSEGRRLTDAERLMLTENTARFIEQLENERIEYERVAALKAAREQLEADHREALQRQRHEATRSAQVRKIALEVSERQLEEDERARLQRQHLEGERVSEFRRGEPHWIWRASWPASTELFASARTLLAGTPHEKILSDHFQKLSAGGRPKTPQDFALLLEAQGVPSDLTLELLVEHKLALKGFRPR